MKLKSIHITTDFKRFKDLSITDIPATAKLVVLTGPNGCGKTSIFEAFNYWHEESLRGTGINRLGALNDTEYTRLPSRDFIAEIRNKLKLIFHEEIINDLTDNDRKRKIFYIRSAYRHETDFASKGIGIQDDILNNSHRAPILIYSEQRVSENYQRIVGESLKMLFSTDSAAKKKTVEEVQGELIGQIRMAMRKVFSDLELQGPGNPTEDGTFRFSKGTSFNFHYKNLSGGEKAAFDLLLDFIIKRSSFDDTIYCIDEPELHMHTKLQAKLLEVMFELIPDNCQLWISTHSIGMARTAAQLHAANPDQVAFIDFHGKDFDKPTTLQPMAPNREFWKQMFHTALDDLAELVVANYVVFCEGKRLDQGGRDPSFDVAAYKTIFAAQYSDVDFIPLGGTKEVAAEGKMFGLLLKELAPGAKCWKVFDRDDRNDKEIQALAADNTQVLKRRDIESYLWDDEILKALCIQNFKPEKLQELLDKKQELINKLPDRGIPKDDIKKIASKLYDQCKKSLNLIQCGNKAESFAIEMLAPLIKPGTKTYEELNAIVMAPRKAE